MQLNKGVDNSVIFLVWHGSVPACLHGPDQSCWHSENQVSVGFAKVPWVELTSTAQFLLKGLLLMGLSGACLDHSAPCHHFSRTNVVAEGCDALLGLSHQDSSNRGQSLLLHASWKNTAWDFLEYKRPGSRIHPFPPESGLLSRPKNA